jgi:hypothetical protein
MNHNKKVCLLLLTVLLFCFTGTIFAQNKLITVDVKNASLEQVFSTIEQQSSYKFSYRNSILDGNRDITLKMEQAPVEDILRAVLPAKGLQYNIASENSIVITKSTTKNNAASSYKKITGNITDTKGEPIIGANIQVKG